MTYSDNLHLDAIAIIGMAGSFPKADNIEVFWSNLKAGLNCITYYTEAELIASGIREEMLHNAHYVKAKGALNDIDLFDANFFGIGPREAELMDPQHRLLLECACKALENAGYNPDTYSGLIGVYAGESMSSYAYLNVLPSLSSVLSAQSLQAAIGNDKDSLTTTIAYHLNLRGPAITVQTSSSTSLVSVCLACQQLLSYQCDMALAGGISVGPPVKSGYLYEEGGISSADGKCRPFDIQSNGFVPGSGLGLVVLKRASEAIKDGDCIWALIKGFAVNNDGNKKVSYSAPSVDAQTEVIRTAQEYAEINPESIGYIEAHGTATNLGDPVEVAALTQAFRKRTERTQFCALGSVKSNIGHLDTAAGIAGLIKTVLCLKHKTLVPTIHFDQPNKALNLNDSPFFIPSMTIPWESDNEPLRAGVTSLGMGGTNSHVILEEAPIRELNLEKATKPLLMTLSAKTETALRRYLQEIKTFIKGTDIGLFSDLIYTLNVGRKPMECRTSIVASSYQELEQTISEMANDNQCFYRLSAKPKIVFIYSDASPLDSRIAEELYAHESVFRQCVEECLSYMSDSIEHEVSSFFKKRQDHSISHNEASELLYFIFQYALASVWNHWGIIPENQIGIGIGQYVATVISKVMSVKTALQLLTHKQDSSSVNASLFKPKIPLVPCSTGKWVTEQEAQSFQFWKNHSYSCNNIIQSINTVTANQSAIFLELGRINECFLCENQSQMTTLGTRLNSPVIGSDKGMKSLLMTLGKLFETGSTINWGNMYKHEKHHRIPVPTYPFEKKRYWIDPPSSQTPLKSSSFETQVQKKYQPRPQLATLFESPVTEHELNATAIWETVFSIKPIGITDNFFDLGGTSLEATILLTAIKDKFHKQITMKEFYTSPTIKQMAKLLAQKPVPSFEALVDEVSSL